MKENMLLKKRHSSWFRSLILRGVFLKMLFCQLLATLVSSRRAHSSYSWRPVLVIEVKFREVPHWNSVRFTIKNNDTRAARRKLDVHAEMGSPNLPGGADRGARGAWALPIFRAKKQVHFQQTHNQGLRQLFSTVSWDLRA